MIRGGVLVGPKEEVEEEVDIIGGGYCLMWSRDCWEFVREPLSKEESEISLLEGGTETWLGDCSKLLFIAEVVA